MTVVASGLTGCMTSLGSFPAVATSEPSAFKMIRPAARAESCRWFVFGSSASADPVTGAIAALRAVDPEVDTLRGASLEVSAWTIGLFGRECVAIAADLGRTVPTVSVPMDHSQHHHHQ